MAARDQQTTASTHDTRQTLTRRGLIAGAAALATAMMAKQAQPVAAATTLQIPTSLGATVNTVFDQTNMNGQLPDGTAILNANANGSFGNVIGLIGQGGGPAGAGVMGLMNGFNYPGAGQGVGVYGGARPDSIGVYGRSAGTGNGVKGAMTNDDPSAIAVFGVAQQGHAVGGQSVSGTGVWGNSVGGLGVHATSFASTGVYGVTSASNQYGVLGTTTAANSTAIAGIANMNGSSAFSGGTTNPNAFAAFFQGTVVVQGNFAVTGSKSAVVQHPRTGDQRLVYCVESPEAWFEDFGEGTLTDGKATVTLDPNYAALVQTNGYHVFLTPHADTNGLHVVSRGGGSFVVHEHKGGTGNLTFSWRVVGKRADGKGERLGKFTMPNLPLPDPSKFPKPPEVKKAQTA